MMAHWSVSVSEWFGKVASYSFPWSIQRLVNRLYVRAFSIDLSEFDPVETYPTLNHLFTRELRRSRIIQGAEEEMVSPCDGKIAAFGELETGMVFRIKGDAYTIEELCGQIPEKGEWSFVNLYLSPRDYHRYHASFSCTVEQIEKIQGKLYPVNDFFMKRIRHIYRHNARVVLSGKDARGKAFFMVMIGALNVGGIKLHDDSSTRPWNLDKGNEVGCFEMGSSIVLLMQDVNLDMELGKSVKFGDVIGEMQQG